MTQVRIGAGILGMVCVVVGLVVAWNGFMHLCCNIGTGT